MRRKAYPQHDPAADVPSNMVICKCETCSKKRNPNPPTEKVHHSSCYCYDCMGASPRTRMKRRVRDT